MNRRRFLETLALGSAAASLPRGFAAVTPDIKFPSDPRQRLAVASYPFRKDLDPKLGKLDLTQFPQMVADRFHVNGIEPLDEHFPSTGPEYLDKLSAALEKARCHVVNIPVGRLASFNDPDPSKRNLAIARAKTWIDVAARLQSPSVRTHVAPVKGVQSDAARTAEPLKAVAEYGAMKNVVVTLENDDPASEDAFFLLDVIDRVRSPWLRALPDFCNSMLLNKGDEYNYKAVREMFQHACNICHVKEAETDEGKLFRVDLGKTFEIANQSGYKGYFSMEFDQDGDPYVGTDRIIAGSLKALGAT